MRLKTRQFHMRITVGKLCRKVLCRRTPIYSEIARLKAGRRHEPEKTLEKDIRILHRLQYYASLFPQK